MTQDSVAVSIPARRSGKSFSGAANGLLRFARRKPLGAFGGFLIIFLLLLAVTAPVVAPYHYQATDVVNRLQGSSADHWLGTDRLGRDIMSRLIWASQTTVIISFGAAALLGIAAAFIGIVSGYYRGWVDIVLQRFVDIWQAFPTLIALIVIVSIIGNGRFQLILVLGLLTAAGTSRVVRSKALSVGSEQYIEAARVIGAPGWRIMVKHILPNVFPTVFVLSAVRLGGIVLTEASLSFLGFGTPPPFPTWGAMLQDSLASAASHPMMAVWPGVAIASAVFGFNLLGDALRDVLDPRMRGR
jgi:peptide/nickel transport system permease protein